MKWYEKVLYWIKVLWIAHPHLKKAYAPILAIVEILREQSKNPYSRGDIKKGKVLDILMKKISGLEEGEASKVIDSMVDALNNLGVLK